MEFGCPGRNLQGRCHLLGRAAFCQELQDFALAQSELVCRILRPGIYVTRLPGVPKMELDFEWTNSESPGTQHKNGQENYWNSNYRNGYLNNGDLMGSTVGRTVGLGTPRQIQFALRFSF